MGNWSPFLFDWFILFDTESELSIIFLEMQEHTKVIVLRLYRVHRLRLYFDKKIKSWTTLQISLIDENLIVVILMKLI